MSGRQEGTSQTTHGTGQLQPAVAEVDAARSGLQATETQTDQIAQIAQAVAITMDKIAATSQEMAEHAAQLRNLSTWPPQGAACAGRQARDHAHAAIPAGHVTAYDGDLPQVTPSGTAVLPLAPPREPAQALADRVVPAEASGTIAAVSQRRGGTSGRQQRNPASRFIETASPARLHAANGARQTQARALQLWDDRSPPADSREIAAVLQTAAVIPLQLGRTLPADQQDLAEVTPTASHRHREQELDLLDWAISNLFHIGLTLLPAARQHGETAQRTAEALQCLDDTICRIRDHVRDAHANGC
jgi:hypothetical protein